MGPLCPECAAGKHQNCDGVADMTDNGKFIGCACAVQVEHPRRPGYLQPNA